MKPSFSSWFHSKIAFCKVTMAGLTYFRVTMAELFTGWLNISFGALPVGTVVRLSYSSDINTVGHL